MDDALRVRTMREKALEYLEAALAITDEIGDATAGYLIEQALTKLRADTWPENLDFPK